MDCPEPTKAKSKKKDQFNGDVMAAFSRAKSPRNKARRRTMDSGPKKPKTRKPRARTHDETIKTPSTSSSEEPAPTSTILPPISSFSQSFHTTRDDELFREVGRSRSSSSEQEYPISRIPPSFVIDLPQSRSGPIPSISPRQKLTPKPRNSAPNSPRKSPVPPVPLQNSTTRTRRAPSTELASQSPKPKHLRTAKQSNVFLEPFLAAGSRPKFHREKPKEEEPPPVQHNTFALQTSSSSESLPNSPRHLSPHHLSPHISPMPSPHISPRLSPALSPRSNQVISPRITENAASGTSEELAPLPSARMASVDLSHAGSGSSSSEEIVLTARREERLVADSLSPFHKKVSLSADRTVTSSPRKTNLSLEQLPSLRKSSHSDVPLSPKKTEPNAPKSSFTMSSDPPAPHSPKKSNSGSTLPASFHFKSSDPNSPPSPKKPLFHLHLPENTASPSPRKPLTPVFSDHQSNSYYYPNESVPLPSPKPKPAPMFSNSSDPMERNRIFSSNKPRVHEETPRRSQPIPPTQNVLSQSSDDETLLKNSKKKRTPSDNLSGLNLIPPSHYALTRKFSMMTRSCSTSDPSDQLFQGLYGDTMTKSRSTSTKSRSTLHHSGKKVFSSSSSDDERPTHLRRRRANSEQATLTGDYSNMKRWDYRDRLADFKKRTSSSDGMLAALVERRLNSTSGSSKSQEDHHSSIGYQKDHPNSIKHLSQTPPPRPILFLKDDDKKPKSPKNPHSPRSHRSQKADDSLS